MTIFVKRFNDWNVKTTSIKESYIEWLIGNIGKKLQEDQGSYDDEAVDRVPDGINYAARWENMVKVYHTIKCVPESLDECVDRLRMNYGDGWQVVHMRGRDFNHIYYEEIVIVIYDELLAMQFKLACM